jgi:hypothetical protein
VLLGWQNNNVEFDVGEIVTTNAKVAQIIGVFEVNRRRKLLGNTFLESLDGVTYTFRSEGWECYAPVVCTTSSRKSKPLAVSGNSDKKLSNGAPRH